MQRYAGLLQDAARALWGADRELQDADREREAAGPAHLGCWVAAADALGHSPAERSPADGFHQEPRCSDWDMSRNYSLVTSGCVFIQHVLTLRGWGRSQICFCGSLM